MIHFSQIFSELLLTVIDETRQKKIQRIISLNLNFRRKVEWKHGITTTYLSLRCNFCARLLKCPVSAVLCHLFRCFDPRFKENIHCHPAFIIRDINSCRKGYSKGRIKSRESDHFSIQFAFRSITTSAILNLDVEKSAVTPLNSAIRHL